MSEAVKAIDFLNQASMLVIPAAGLGNLCWRWFRDASLRKHTPTTFFEKDYVPTIAPLLKQEPKQKPLFKRPANARLMNRGF